jgi:hypothetical protein
MGSIGDGPGATPVCAAAGQIVRLRAIISAAPMMSAYCRTFATERVGS